MRQKALCPPARGTLVIAMCNQARSMATVLPRTPTRCTRAYAAVSVIRFPRRTPPSSCCCCCYCCCCCCCYYSSSSSSSSTSPSRPVDRFRNGVSRPIGKFATAILTVRTSAGAFFLFVIANESEIYCVCALETRTLSLNVKHEIFIYGDSYWCLVCEVHRR